MAFLNGYLKENFFMSQLEGFVVKGQEQKVCKLIKSLYGLKKAPQAWYEKLTEHILKLDYHQTRHLIYCWNPLQVYAKTL